MILHTVLLQPKPETTTQEIEEALAQICSLQQKIPGILDVQAGENLNSTNNSGYTYGFVMRFVDQEHLGAYAPHPDHQRAGAELRRICSTIIDFDLILGS